MGRSRYQKRQSLVGWLFVSPWVLGFSLFVAFPFVVSFYFSFCEYNILTPPRWVGLRNYNDLFFHDPQFWKSLYNTVFYAAISVPLAIVFGVGLALLLSTNMRGMGFFRTVFYLPSIVPIVAQSILWIWLFNPQLGLINSILGAMGIDGPAWLASTEWSKPALIIMGLWGVGNAMLIYLAGLKDIPTSFYEAAEVDGANIWQRTRYIALPMLSPVIFFNAVMGIIYAFQYFTQAYIMTGGGPENSTTFTGLYIFQQAWSYLNMGYASAVAWILFVIIVTITYLVFRTHTKWVHYER
ncbi:carbohydrate ABC transporter permease [Candidatus Hydrogenedentota bacterium]